MPAVHVVLPVQEHSGVSWWSEPNYVGDDRTVDVQPDLATEYATETVRVVARSTPGEGRDLRI